MIENQTPIPPSPEAESPTKPKGPLKQIVNVKWLQEQKKQKLEGPKMPKEELVPINNYLIFGMIASLIFALFSIIYIQFLYVAPLGVIIALVTWAFKQAEKKREWKKRQALLSKSSP